MPEGVGRIEVLSKKSRQLLDQQLGTDERVAFCLVGLEDQTLVALDRRILVLKRGFMAGATFGSKITSFAYSDITGIEVRTGILRAWIELTTPSFQGRASPSLYASDQESNVYKLPNCLPLSKRLLPTYQPYLDQLRERIGGAKIQAQTQMLASSALGAAPSLTSELERLAQLREAGHLSDAEYEQAKRKLLA